MIPYLIDLIPTSQMVLYCFENNLVLSFPIDVVLILSIYIHYRIMIVSMWSVKKTYTYTHTHTQQPSWFNKNGATKCVHDAENIFQNVNTDTFVYSW